MMRYDASIDVRCMIPELYYHMCIISMEFPVSGITVPLILNEFFLLFQRTETEIRSYASRYCGMLFSELILRSVDRKYFKKNQYMESHASETPATEKEEKKEEYVYNPNEYSLESILKILLTKMSTITEVYELLCYSQTILYILFSSRDTVLERDITILVNSLFGFLRLHPIPAVKASVQHIIFSGICQYLSESFISVTATIIIKTMADYKSGDDLPSEIVAITAGELLAKILPILGEAIKSQLDELLCSLLPILSCDSTDLQNVVLRSLVFVGTTDASVVEVIMKQLLLQLLKQVEAVKSEKDEQERQRLLESDFLTGYCKGVGYLSILLYAKKHDIPSEVTEMIRRLSGELMALWTEHTDPDMRVNSVTGNVGAFQKRAVYQYCFEGAWLLTLGLCAMGRDGGVL